MYNQNMLVSSPLNLKKKCQNSMRYVVEPYKTRAINICGTRLLGNKIIIFYW